MSSPAVFGPSHAPAPGTAPSPGPGSPPGTGVPTLQSGVGWPAPKAAGQVPQAAGLVGCLQAPSCSGSLDPVTLNTVPTQRISDNSPESLPF